MNLNKTLRKIFCLCGVIALSACASTGVGGLQAPYVSLSNITPAADMTFFEQRYDVALRVQNPNNVDLSVTGLNYRVILNDREFARGVSRDQMKIPALGEKVVHVTVTSGAFDWFKQINRIQSNPDLKPSYKVEGTLHLQGPFSRSLSFENSGSFDME